MTKEHLAQLIYDAMLKQVAPTDGAEFMGETEDLSAVTVDAHVDLLSVAGAILEKLAHEKK